MNQFKVKLKLPIIITRFSAKYSETEKPSGLGYLLLKMIGLRKSDMSFRNLLEEFGLPIELFRLFRDEIIDLKNRGMVRVTGGLDVDDDISHVKLTAEGQKAFDKGVIAKHMQDLNSDIYFIPARANEKYINSHQYKLENPDNHSELISRFKDVEPDFDDIEDYLKKKKEKFGVGLKEDIFDITIKSVELGLYNANLTTNFDGLTATFSTPVNGDIDARFIKSRFKAKDFFDSFNYDEMKYKSTNLEIKKWSFPSSKFESFDYLIPSSFIIDETTLNIENGDFCDLSIIHHSLTEYLNDCEYHLVKIESANIGYAFRFEIMDVGIAGFEGQKKINIIKRIRIDKTEIENIVTKVLDKLNLKNDEELSEYLNLCQKMSYEDKIEDALKKEISGKGLKDIPNFIGKISVFKKQKWFKNLNSWIEDDLISRLEKGEKPTNILDSVEKLKSTGIEISGVSILHNLFSDDVSKNLELADRCFDLGFEPSVVVDKSAIMPIISKNILNGVKTQGVSSIFNSASLSSHNLRILKDTTGIQSVDEYSFDIRDLNEKQVSDIKKSYTTLKESIDLFLKPPYYDSSSKDMRLINRFVEIFEEIAKTLERQNKISDLNGLKKEKHARTFGISLGIHLEKNLKDLVGNGDLSENLIRGKDEGLMTEEDYLVLDNFREFRNKCAHSLEELEMPKNKQVLINLVSSLTSSSKKEVQK